VNISTEDPTSSTCRERCVVTVRSIKKVDGNFVGSWVNAHISDSVAASVRHCPTF